MQNLNRALTEIDVMLPPKQYIEKILQVTCDNLDYLFGTVIEVDDEGEAHMLTSYDLPEVYPELINRVNVPILSGPAGEAFETGKIVVLHDPAEDSRLKPWDNLRILMGSLETIIWVPLFKKGKVFGIFVLYSDIRREISDRELSILERIGVMISIAITSNQYLDKLSKKTNELEKEIVERRKAENQLQKLTDELEIKVEERTLKLSKVNKKLQLFRDQIDQSNDAIFVIDPKSARILDTNIKGCTSLGYTSEELLNMKAIDFDMIFQDIDSWKYYIDKIMIDDCQLIDEGVHKRKDGTTFPIEVNAKLITQDEKNYLVAVIRDVTERKQAEKEVRLNEARFAALLKISQMKEATINEIADFVLEEGIKLTESKIGYLNAVNEDESIQTVLSYSKDVMEECNLDNQIEFTIKDLGLGAECFKQRTAVIINDYSASHPSKKGYPDSHLPLFRYLCIPLFYKGKIVATMSVANKDDDYNDSDVQQLTLLMNGMWEHIKRIESEKKIMNTKNYLDMIVSMSHDGIMVVDSEGKIEFANNACCKMSGYTKEEIINKPVLETIDPEYTEFMINRWNEVQASESGTYETVMVKKNGTKKNLLVSHNNVEINGQQKYVAIIKDISTGITEYINAIAQTLKD